jgi:branched-chain amino acid transport system permease protein
LLNVPKNLKFWLLFAALLLLPFITEALFGRGWVRIADFAMLYIMLALGLNKIGRAHV